MVLTGATDIAPRSEVLMRGVDMPTEVVSVNCTLDMTPESVSLIPIKGSCPKPAVAICCLKLASGDLEFIGALDIAL